MVKDKETGEQVAGCCAFVHPGEEGTGRRLFEERTTTNEAGETTTQKACVRLTGKAGFYERRRLRLSWPAWCERQGIPYTANAPREPTQVQEKPRAQAQKQRRAPRGNTLTLPADREAAVALLMAKLGELGAQQTVAVADAFAAAQRAAVATEPPAGDNGASCP
jgi:hypothetical protein